MNVFLLLLALCFSESHLGTDLALEGITHDDVTCKYAQARPVMNAWKCFASSYPPKPISLSRYTFTDAYKLRRLLINIWLMLTIIGSVCLQYV